MKKLTLFALVSIALLVSGCGGIGATPAPTYTPLPTYTPQPTFTPPPTPTATFLPTATPIPIETATPAEAASAATPEGAAATATPAGTQVTLAFGTNLREGPGPEYEIIDVLNAGEPLLVLGRNNFGDWLFIQTATNQQGWVARIQIQGQLEIARIPLADDLPTPDPDAVTNDDDDEDEDGEEGEDDEPEATAAPVGDVISLTIIGGSPAVCQDMTAVANPRFVMEDITDKIKPFEYGNFGSIVSQSAAQIDWDQSSLNQALFDFFFEGNLTPGGCDESDNTCDRISFRLCTKINMSTPQGAYAGNLEITIGKQSYDQFYPSGTALVNVDLIVIEPTPTG